MMMSLRKFYLTHPAIQWKLIAKEAKLTESEYSMLMRYFAGKLPNFAKEKQVIEVLYRYGYQDEIDIYELVEEVNNAIDAAIYPIQEVDVLTEEEQQALNILNFCSSLLAYCSLFESDPRSFAESPDPEDQKGTRVYRFAQGNPLARQIAEKLKK